MTRRSVALTFGQAYQRIMGDAIVQYPCGDLQAAARRTSVAKASSAMRADDIMKLAMIFTSPGILSLSLIPHSFCPQLYS
jgi:hypothetical protein